MGEGVKLDWRSIEGASLEPKKAHLLWVRTPHPRGRPELAWTDKSGKFPAIPEVTHYAHGFSLGPSPIYRDQRANGMEMMR